MQTFRLPILPMIVGLILLIAGYHFATLDLKVAGALFIAWGSITHFKNIQIVRKQHRIQRNIL